MNAANVEAISLPADLSARASSRATFVALGTVSFSQEGIKYMPASHFMRAFFKINFVNKLVWKYQIGQTIKYGDIVDVRPFKNNVLELVTDQVNGSYFFSVPYSQSDSLSDICAFIQRCREEGFDRAAQDQALFQSVESRCTTAQKAMLVPTIILMLASLAIAWYLDIWIGFLLAFFAPIPADQSGSRILYAISIVLLIAIAVLTIPLLV